MTEPVISYLGVPISHSYHFGNLREMQTDMELYLARTDLATFNFLTAIYPVMLETLRPQPLTADMREDRGSYDAAFRRFYREMATPLPNGMTLREGCLQLRPAQLVAQLQTWSPASTYTAIFLGTLFNTDCPRLAVQLAEVTASTL